MFVTAWGGFDIDNKPVAIPTKIDENKRNTYKTIYEALNENYFK